MKSSLSGEALTLVFIYSGPFAERVIRNLINDPSFCKPCGLYCDSCKYGAYSHVGNIKAALELPGPEKLPVLVDDPQKYMPKRIPRVDLCIASALQKDLLLELPEQLSEAGVKGLVLPVEDFTEVPSGLKKQVQEKCEALGLENAFPKPFCSLEPSKNSPTISRFVNELEVGKPSLEISIGRTCEGEVIESANVRRSAPCGSTWYVARRLTGVKRERESLYDSIAKSHHSYPCTATMNEDPELEEPILHRSGFIIREAVESALR